jgi:hypothetical protein
VTTTEPPADIIPCLPRALAGVEIAVQAGTVPSRMSIRAM